MIPKHPTQFSTVHIYNISVDFSPPCNSNRLLFCIEACILCITTCYVLYCITAARLLCSGVKWLLKEGDKCVAIPLGAELSSTASRSWPRSFGKINKTDMYVCFCPILKKK